ncbi:MAG: hypothetical protein M1821_004768 [Bathelium mastoideum]|nr:MAG: hypothetical protein M1821_004768 [Bathelium mastoideum]KAI9692177.1 MAG: hypothetical protein M1822_006407 [Bathelium mastoideum]
MTASSDFYDDDDALSRSPGLQPVYVKAKPSPSPPPFVPQRKIPPSPEDVSTHSSKRRKRANRPKARASQGDAVLINFLGNTNHPDIARTAALEPLNSASQSEASESEDEMEAVMNSRPGTGPDPLNQNSPPSGEFLSLAKAAHRRQQQQTMQLGIPTSNAPESRKDSAVSTSPEDERKGSVEGSRSQFSALSMTSPSSSREYDKQRSRFSSLDESIRTNNEGSANVVLELRQPSRFEHTESYAPPDSINDSPRLRKNAISPTDMSPRQTLPAMRDPTSPPNPQNVGRTLPSFHQISELADAGNQEIEARHNSISHQHRPSNSISSGSTQSAIATSPNQISRNFLSSAQRRSPPSFGPPLNSHTSPTSTHSLGEISPDNSSFRLREIPSRSPQSANNNTMSTGPYFFSRHPSQAAEPGSGSYPSSVPSTSTAESHPSTGDGYSSSGHTPNEPRLVLDGQPRLTLPPIPPQGPREGQPPAGGYRCDHAGCTAAPFQTQYLLK